MSVAQPDDVAYHRHDGGGAGVALGDVPPLIGPRAGAPQLSEIKIQTNAFTFITILKTYMCK